jgi:hypothetical protein
VKGASGVAKTCDFKFHKRVEPPPPPALASNDDARAGDHDNGSGSCCCSRAANQAQGPWQSLPLCLKCVPGMDINMLALCDQRVQ